MIELVAIVWLYFAIVLLKSGRDVHQIRILSKEAGIPMMEVPVIELWVYMTAGWLVGLVAGTIVFILQ